MRIELKVPQYDFIYSKTRFPAFVGGWACGKTLCAIIRSILYSENIPNNLGIIFRKTARSLFDSTLKDFERYSNMKVDSNRNCIFSNKSTIMFRHIDEINDINQQNINLGWFYIEQGDELESDKEFFTLFGRLRREVTPTQDFIKLGLPYRSGWVIANAGDHWMKPLWLERKLDDAELIQMQTQDNADVLPADFIKSLEILKANKPDIYNRFVMNDWNAGREGFWLFNAADLEALKGKHTLNIYPKRFGVCDPAAGGDEAVLLDFQDSKVMSLNSYHLRDTMKLAGEIMIHYRKKQWEKVLIDVIGLGSPLADRLIELGAQVYRFNSSHKSVFDSRYINLRAEAYDTASQAVLDGNIEYPDDDETRKQLTQIQYEIRNSNGKIKIEDKLAIKKRLGCSPDRADSWVMGIWYFRKHAAQIIGTKFILNKPRHSIMATQKGGLR